MPNTMTLIQKITVGATGASSVTFTNIPQTYTDLKIVASVRSNRTGAINSFMRLYPNGNTTGITYRALFGSGSAASSFTQSTASEYVGEINATNSTSNTFSSTEIYIPNYTSGAQKSYSVDFVIENNATLAYMGLIGELWANTSAITSIQLLDGLASFVQHSTFYLYGVTKSGSTTPSTAAAYATGGDTITTDGTYWYHAFRSSGTFTPRKSLSCDVLVIAGGGGGSSGGGGGGAGGLFYAASNNLTNIAYSVTVGAGGSGAFENKGTNGSNSQFGSLTAAVGGGTGGSDYLNTIAGETGGNGGSGGGQAMNPLGGSTAGTGTVGQGNNGGTGSNSAPAYGGGGGGGAGAVGGNGSGSNGGNGGAGSSSYSSWGSATGTGQNVSGTYWFAGGGAGGTNTGGGGASTGGNGGGGAGGFGTAQPGVAALANTGGGGGASSGGAAGGTSAAGGSGIVIIRYPV